MNDFKRLLHYVRPYWATFALAMIAMVLMAVFETATGALLVPLLDQFSPIPATESKTLFDLNSLIPRDDWYRAWIVISLLLVGFTIAKGFAEYFSSYLMAKIGQSVVLKLRAELYSHLLNQSTVFFESHRTNFLVSRLVVSCSAIEMAVSSNLRDVLRESFMLVFFLGAAFYFNWRLTLGSLIIAPIIAFLTSNFSRRLRKLADVSLEGNKRLSDTAQETISNQVIVKAYGSEQREKKRFMDVASLIARANLRSAGISALSPPSIELVGMVAVVVLFFFGLQEINAARLDPSQFFTFIFFLFRSYDPMRKISRQHNEITKAFAAAKDVWGILDQDETLPEKDNAVELEPLKTSIRIGHVSFSYRNNKRSILKNIDLEVDKGETVALVGESGGGKSSLTRLIQRLYDPKEGAILWDGVDLRDATIKSLREQMALVTQETVLFNDTIKENIAYGKPGATEAEIAEAARIALADEFIAQLPNGYDTLVGERGVLLSGGQRQRIAIARAVLMDAHVLILDEATSALDTESESIVQQALANLMRDRTSIVIAHRLSTVRKANKIVVMEKGRILETGTHEELLAMSGTYKKLYELQFADEEVENEL
ncbi:MAG: ATP-binding cassette domain-containing protein [Acidobacteria bacterium]|nr:ATP-binding cassette domain-containing protein [Acidobacteriota bacterium]MBK9529975.1 ATP-binding cassette domain-containing protein [Acidobacteriota bacterium]MBP7474293.1 ATP-binding cassette domain-containing protein [Pyrinomonadaceae bacterium]MBP9109153.1 ATP-binding cassette domain-containing protein [Pyrinomonadaceae bacterium]